MKKRIGRYGPKLLTMFLSLLLIFYLFPSAVYAERINDGRQSPVPREEKSFVKDIYELTDRREESVKHFRLEDGNIMAVQYADAVHRADANGTWQNIDNTLSAKGSELATSDTRVKFAKKITGNETLFTLQEHNRKITMRLDGAKKKTSGTITNTNTEFEKDATQLQKLMTLDKLSAKILYADILDGVDLEYVVVSNDIKENIIVKEPQETYTYSFTLQLNNLEAELTEVGSVVVLDPETRETIYVIPAPVVYDFNNVYAQDEDAFYTLTQSENNTYTLSVTVNADWMNHAERSFPVVVDPTIRSGNPNVIDLDFFSGNSNVNYESSDSLYASNDWTGYWKTELPALPLSAYIVDAEIAMSIYGGEQPEETYIGVYQVISQWDSDLNWNKAHATPPEGELSAAITDYCHIIFNNGTYGDQGWYFWNITGIVKLWYDGTPNYGIAFRSVDNSNSEIAIFHSNDYSEATYRPKLTITYKDMKGVEPYWSFSSQNAGLAGTGYINRATGALTFTKGLLSTTDSLFPYTPTLVYSTSLVEKLQNATQLCLWSYPYAQTAFLDSYMPLGFKWNMQETLIKKAYYKPDGSSSEFFIWSDADGTEHYFLPVGNSATEYEDEDGLQLKLAYNSVREQFFLTDDSKTVKWFTEISTNPGNDVLESWYLTSIVDKNGNEISFTYNNLLQLTEVCLTPNGSTKITFLKILYSSNLPYLIWNEVSKDAVVFRYLTPDIDNLSPSTAMFLQRLDYAHGNANTTATDWLNYYNNGTTTNITVDGTVSYTYDSYGYLIEAKDDVSDYRISYTYTNGKVTSVKEYGQTPETGQNPTPELGQELRLSYYNGYTEVRTSGSDDVIGNADDLITRYTFDQEGRAIGAYTTDPAGTQIYGGAAGTYETDGKIKNNVKESVTVGGSATNYLINGGFESIQSTYVANSWTSSSNNVRYTSSYAENGGNYGAYFKILSDTTDSISQYTQLPTGTYTISMSVNTFNCLNVKAYIIVYSLNQSNNVLVEEIPINEYYASGCCSFVSTSFEAGSYNANGSENFQIIIQTVGGSNLASGEVSIAVDNIMLEENIGNSNYSLIQYGNFDRFMIDSSGTYLATGANYWISDLNNLAYGSAGAPFRYAGKLEGSITTAKYLKQTFYNASSYDLSSYDWGEPYNDSAMTFTVSGFAKGTGQVASVNSAFRLRVDVKYYMGSGNDDEIEPFYFDFQTDCKDWQFICGTFTTQEYRLVHSIDIYCEYNYQPGGTALFDNIAVFQSNDDSVVKYRYYTDNPEFQNHQYYHVEYNPTLAGLVHVKESGYYTEIYEYNNDRQLVRKINNRGELYEYIYAYNGVDIASEIYYKFTSYGTSTIYPYLADNPDSIITKTPQTKTTYAYNGYGQITESLTFEAVYSGTSVVAKTGTKYIRSAYSYQTTAGSRIFGTLLTETDSLSRVTQYYYDNSNGRLLACVNASEGTGTCYTYDAIGNVTAVRPATYVSPTIYQAVSNAENVSYQYDNNNQLQHISTDTTDYSFSYDVFGNATSVLVGTQQLASYLYNDYNGKLNAVVYGNGYAEKYVYDKLDNLKEVWYTNNYQGNNTVWSQAYEYTYTAYGQLYRFDNLLTNRSIIYKYNTSGKLTNFIEFDSTDYVNEFSSNIYYNNEGNVSSLFYHYDYKYSNSTVADASLHYYHAYNSDGMLRYLSLSTETTRGQIDYSYDTYKRLSTKTTDFYVSGNSSTRFTNTVSYGYQTNGNYTSAQISSYTSYVNNTLTTQYSYTYDDRGNIIEIIDLDQPVPEIICQYEYDELGQLIREDNKARNYSYTYHYDDAGNITAKKRYAFTTGTLGNVQYTYNYTYGDSEWGDLLTEYSGWQIEYDEIGNPTLIVSGDIESGYWYGYQLEWDGRNLVSYTETDHYDEYYDIYQQIFYTYNDDGIRTSKIADGTTHEYLLDGSRIIGEIVRFGNSESYRLTYLYDDYDGSPVGMQYRTPSMAEGAFYTFWFEKNLQGDIIAVYNEGGTKIISYTYDAWGNVSQSITNYTGNNRYATLNPFRYRGYYYDTDTGYYYLQSRYYNPTWGRFINADGLTYLGAGDELLGFNLFAYCGNNPVMGYDPEGTWNWGKFLAVAGVAAVIVAAVVVTVATCGAGSVAGTIAISSAITIAARTTEVAVLQGKKSAQDGDSNADIASDIVDAIFDNGLKEIGFTPITKAIGFGSGFFSQSVPFQEALDVMKVDGFSIKGFATSAGGEFIDRFRNIGENMSMPASKSSMIVAYGFAAYNVGNTIYSCFSRNPLQRAKQRGYVLK